jgi:hypothetical protein
MLIEIFAVFVLFAVIVGVLLAWAWRIGNTLGESETLIRPVQPVATDKERKSARTLTRRLYSGHPLYEGEAGCIGWKVSDYLYFVILADITDDSVGSVYWRKELARLVPTFPRI